MCITHFSTSFSFEMKQKGIQEVLIDVYGCGSKPMVPLWGRFTTHFGLFEWEVHSRNGVLTHGHIETERFLKIRHEYFLWSVTGAGSGRTGRGLWLRFGAVRPS